jgi:hypothetical protein
VAVARAWRATGLALVAFGLLGAWLLTPFGPPWAAEAIAAGLVAAWAVVGVAGGRRARALGEAIGAAKPLPPSRLPLLVSGVVAAAGPLVVVLVVVGRRR